MSGRLYKAVGAAGSIADTARIALAEDAQRPRVSALKDETSHFAFVADVPDGPAVLDAVEPAILEAVSARSLAPMDPLPVKESLEEFEHLFGTASSEPEAVADEVEAAIDDEDEWEEVEIRTFNWGQIGILLTATTLVLGLISGIAFGRFGLFVGIPYLAIAVFLALRADFDDRLAPAVMTPLAWFVAVIGPGQFTVTHDGSALLTQGLLIFQGLSDNAIWIIGSVIGTAGIAVARGRKGY